MNLLARFFLTVVLRVNMKHQPLKAVLGIVGKKHKDFPPAAGVQNYFPSSLWGNRYDRMHFLCVCVLSNNEGGEDGKVNARTGLTF